MVMCKTVLDIYIYIYEKIYNIKYTHTYIYSNIHNIKCFHGRYKSYLL